MKKALLTLVIAIVAIVVGLNIWVANNSEQVFQSLKAPLAEKGVRLNKVGTFDISLFPSPALNLEEVDVEIDGLEAKVGKLDASVGWAVIMGSINVSHVVLTDAILTVYPDQLAADNSAQPRARAKQATTPQETTVTAPATSSAPVINVDTVMMRNVEVNVIQPSTDTTIVFTLNSLDVNDLNLSGSPFPIAADLAFNHNGQTAELSLAADVQVDDKMVMISGLDADWSQSFAPMANDGNLNGSLQLSAGTIITDIKLAFDNSRVEIKSDTSDFLKKGDATLIIASDSLAELLKVEQPGLDKPTLIKQRITLSPTKIAMKSEDSVLSGEKFSLDATIDHGRKVPRVDASIYLNKLAIVSPPATEEAAPQKARARSAAPAEDSQLDLGFLKDFDVHADVILKQFLFNKIEVADISVAAKGDPKGAFLDLKNATFAKGNISGDVDVLNQRPVKAIAKLDLKNLELASLMPQLNLDLPIAGGHLNGAINTNAQLTNRPLTTANGSGEITLRDTKLVGTNISASACEAISQIRSKPYPADNFGADTELNLVELGFTMKNGVADIDDINIGSDLVTVSGEAELNLPATAGKMTFDVKALPALVTNCPAINQRLQKLNIPMLCTLSSDAQVACGVNQEKIAELVAQALRDSLENKLKDKLNELFK